MGTQLKLVQNPPCVSWSSLINTGLCRLNSFTFWVFEGFQQSSKMIFPALLEDVQAWIGVILHAKQQGWEPKSGDLNLSYKTVWFLLIHVYLIHASQWLRHCFKSEITDSERDPWVHVCLTCLTRRDMVQQKQKQLFLNCKNITVKNITESGAFCRQRLCTIRSRTSIQN